MKSKQILIGIIIMGVLSMPLGMMKKYVNDPFPWSIGNNITYTNLE